MFFGKKKSVTDSNIEAVIPILVRISDFIDTSALSRNELIELPDRKLVIGFQCLQSYLRGAIDALAMCAMSNAEIIKLRSYEHLNLNDKARRIHTEAVATLKDILISSTFYKKYFNSYAHKDNPLIDSYKHSHIEFDSSAIKHPEFMSRGIDHIMAPVTEVLREMDSELDLMSLLMPSIDFKMSMRSDSYEQEILMLLKKAGV